MLKLVRQRRPKVATKLFLWITLLGFAPVVAVFSMLHVRTRVQYSDVVREQHRLVAQVARSTVERYLADAVLAARQTVASANAGPPVLPPVFSRGSIRNAPNARRSLRGEPINAYWPEPSAFGLTSVIVTSDSSPSIVVSSSTPDGARQLVVQLDYLGLMVELDSLLGLHALDVCLIDGRGAGVFCVIPSGRRAVDGAFRVGQYGVLLPGDQQRGSLALVAYRPNEGLGSAAGWAAGVVVVLSLLLVVFQLQKTLRPIGMLRAATLRLTEGHFSPSVDVRSHDELEVFATEFNEMADRFQAQFRAMGAMNEIGRAVLSNTEIDRIVDTVLDRTPSIISCDAVLFLIAPRGGSEEWTLTGRLMGGTRSITTSVKLTNRERDELWNSAEHIEHDLNSSPRSYLDLVELVKGGILHFLTFGIQNKGRVAGALVLGYPEKPTIDVRQLEAAHRLVDQVTVALSNANLIAELNSLNIGTLSALANTIDASSPWTAGHSTRVTELALQIGGRLGLPTDKLSLLQRGGLLHDIGKIGVPPAVLNKPDRLNDDEMKIMQDHTVLGAKILGPIPQYRDLIPMVRHHHERIDGQGYPDGLAGDAIPFLARVLAVADVFDALRSDRPYRKGWSEEEVVAEISKMSGTHLDPTCVEAFLLVMAPDQVHMRKSIPYLSVEIDDFYKWIE